jgi:hypothetical protein
MLRKRGVGMRYGLLKEEEVTLGTFLNSVARTNCEKWMGRDDC